MLIKNKFFSIELNDRTGGIVSLKNSLEKEFILKDENRELFSLWMLNEKDKRVKLYGNYSESVTFFKEKDKTIVSFRKIAGYNIDADITLRHPANEPFIYLNVRVLNKSDLHLDKIHLPKLIVPADLVADGGSSRLFTPMMEGAIIEDLSLREKYMQRNPDTGFPACGWEGIYPGSAHMQFMAYYDERGGLYIAAHDKFCNPKVIEFNREGKGINIEFQAFTGTDDTSDFSLDYEIVLGVFEGNYFDAAEIYRSFVEKSGIINIPKLRDNPSIPDWLKKSPVVVCYPVRGEVDSHFEDKTEYYPYTRALPYIIGLGKDLDSAMLPIMMHWEGTAPWAPPYVWPPFGDFDNFTEYVNELHKSGNYAGVYCSGIAWTQRSKLVPEYSREEDFEREKIDDIIVKGPGNKKQWSYVCGGVGYRYDMCPACDKTKEIAAKEIEKIVKNSDLDYVQFFDQNLGGGAYACYNKAHGHCYGPGKWQVKEMLALIEKMNKVLEDNGKKGKVLIGCEANAAEPYISKYVFNDSRHNMNYRIGVPVPVYNYIFHEYVSNFMGNQNTSYGVTDFKEYPDNVYYRYAYSFAQGDVLTIVLKDKGKIHWDWCTPWNQPEINQAEIKKYIRNMNDWRKNAAKGALQFGRMIKPYPYTCGVYSEKIVLGGEHNYPSVVSNCYETEKGVKQQVFVNFLPYEQTVKVTVGDVHSVAVIEDAFGKNVNKVKAENGVFDLVLPARSVKVAEVSVK